jgi:hypothetical protein
MGATINAYKILVGKPEKRPLAGPRRRWKDNINIDLRETGFGGVDWIHLVQDMNRWPGEHSNELSGYIRHGEFLD